MDEGRTFVEGPGGAWRELPAGTMVGDYRVEGLLGRGGMGAVYVAEHTRMGKRFALKVLPPELGGDRRFRERFDEEARRMASLEHAHIVTIYNAGESGGLHYFAMELLDGDLEEKRKAESGKLPEAEVRAILRQVLEALVYAHGEGVIHRDLKPANILLKRGGAEAVVKIADFGLAQVLGEDYMQSVVERTVAASILPSSPESRPSGKVPPQRDPSPSSSPSSSSCPPHRDDPTLVEGRGSSGAPRRSGSAASPGLAGTVHFIAPEVLEGGLPDARADLYAVGVMGYSLLTGRRPLGRYKDASRLVPGLDPAWDDWLNGLMEVEPEDRTRDAATALAGLPKERLAGDRTTEEGDVSKEPNAPAGEQRAMAVRQSGKDESCHGASPRGEDSGDEEANGEKTIQQSIPAAACSGETEDTAPYRLVTHSCAVAAPAKVKERGSVLDRKAQPELPGGVKMAFTWLDAMNLWVGTYEVTNMEFRAFNAGHDSGKDFNGPRQPVVRVSYNEALAFCEWLTEHERAAGRLSTKERYRLPDGNEWTRFARCGTIRRYPWGDSMPPTRGNYSNRISGYDAGAGRSLKVEDSGCNEWGLYGVGGNVWEWTSEQRIGSARVVRGASWSHDFREYFLRIDYRYGYGESFRDPSIGFRVVCGP